MTKLFVGIDPGAMGAIAVLDEEGKCVELFDMPTTDQKYLDKMREWLDKKVDKEVHVMMENVHAMPMESTVAGFTFGKNVGKAELLALAIATVKPPHKVTPKSWKTYFDLKKFKEESKYEYKKRSVNRAKIEFPYMSDQLLITKDGRAEALLIAKYLRDYYCKYKV